MVMVLIIDNDNAQLVANADALLRSGHQVCTALSGQEAIDELAWNLPDALVCDSNLPDLEGCDFLRHVRRDERYSELPIVFVGTANDKALRLEAFRNGADDYLPRPFEPEELVRRLECAVGRIGSLERPITLPPPCDVQGRLENFPISSVLTLLASEQKTGVLLAQSAGQRVRMLLRSGNVLHVESAPSLDMPWQQCLRRALGWKFGDFWFSVQPVTGEPELQARMNEPLDGERHGARFGRRA